MFISRHTGEEINELEHIFQSIEMILQTRIGSRVMRRDFGSRLPDLIDQPLNQSTLTAIYAAANEAISIWEPRVEVIQTQLDPTDAKEGIVRLRIAVQSDVGIIEDVVTISEGITETPLDPSDPIVPPTPSTNFNVFMLGDNVFMFGDNVFGWSN